MFLTGRNYKARLLNPIDWFWDVKLGISTFGFYPAVGKPADEDWRVHYTPTPYADIFRLLHAVELRGSDVFIDVGCGLGRAVFAASYMGAKRAIGIEVEKSLCDRAIENIKSSRLTKKNIEFVCLNAQDYLYTDGSVFFMFHPFGEHTMRKFLYNIGANHTALNLRIIYLNPVYDSVLQQTKWLEPVGRVSADSSWLSSANRYDATLWRSR